MKCLIFCFLSLTLLVSGCPSAKELSPVGTTLEESKRTPTSNQINKFLVKSKNIEKRLGLSFELNTQPPLNVSILQFLLVKKNDPSYLCELKVIDKNGSLITGTYVLGNSHPNYEKKGCKKTLLDKGDYDLIVLSQFGQISKRIWVQSDGALKIAEWEEYSGLYPEKI